MAIQVVAEFSRLSARLSLLPVGAAGAAAALAAHRTSAPGVRPLEMFFPFDPYLLHRSARLLDLEVGSCSTRCHWNALAKACAWTNHALRAGQGIKLPVMASPSDSRFPCTCSRAKPWYHNGCGCYNAQETYVYWSKGHAQPVAAGDAIGGASDAASSDDDELDAGEDATEDEDASSSDSDGDDEPRSLPPTAPRGLAPKRSSSAAFQPITGFASGRLRPFSAHAGPRGQSQQPGGSASSGGVHQVPL